MNASSMGDPGPVRVPADETSAQAMEAAADWYHAGFTGLVLFAVSRLGVAEADRFVHEVFSHQRREKFLAGLAKLGLDRLPHAVAAAQYHYLSNWIGGVAVEYMYESDRKAWIRYAAPRWIWAGTALCGVPSSVTRAMLRGWHAQNGITLGNPRLGFVCTKMATDGDSGLEGYYFEYDHDLTEAERLRFAPDEDAPDFDPAAAPVLPTATWPAERLAKARRNYAMEYLRSAYVVAHRIWGPQQAAAVLGLAARLVGMQFFHQVARGLDAPLAPGAAGLADFVVRFARAQGDRANLHATARGFRVELASWQFMSGLEAVLDDLAGSWNEGLVGALQAHDRRLRLSFELLGGREKLPAWTIEEGA